MVDSFLQLTQINKNKIEVKILRISKSNGKVTYILKKITIEESKPILKGICSKFEWVTQVRTTRFGFIGIRIPKSGLHSLSPDVFIIIYIENYISSILFLMPEFYS